MIPPLTNNTFYSAVNEQHRAHAAGGHPAIDGGALNRDAELGSLTDSVLLCMDRTHTVRRCFAVRMNKLLEIMPYFIAMRQTRGRSNVSRNEDLTVSHDYTATSSAIAGGPGGHGMCDVKKVIIP